MSEQIIKHPGRRILNNVPFSLTTLRLLIAPVLIVMAMLDAPRPIFTVLIITAFMSDWLDGVTARRLGVATVFLRRYDIVADLTFYFAVLISSYILESEAVYFYRYQFILLLILEILCQVLHFARFRSMTATHSYICKLWGVSLAVTAVALLGFSTPAPFLQVTFVLGYLAYLDVLLIIILAHRTPIDVVSAYHVALSAREFKKTI